MDKNNIIGIVLIALVMLGFFGYQSRQVKKQAEYQAYLDSIALASQPADTVLADEAVPERPALPASAPVFADSLLTAAASAEEQFVTISNEKLEVVLTTKGAQPYSVKVNGYQNYDKSDLYILRGGKSNLGFIIYAPKAVDTRLVNFRIVPEESNDSTVVMRLPFSNGGYIEQKYTLLPDSYSVSEQLSFVGMQDLIPRNINSFDIQFEAMIPRMEKGYKNESQYSRLNYFFPDTNKPENIGNGRKGNKRFDNRVEWFAFQQQFFSAIMRAPNYFTAGDFSIDFQPKDNEEGDLMACSAKMRAEIRPSDNIAIPFEFYFGPNDFKGL